MGEIILDTESIQNSFEDFIQLWGIDNNTERMDADDKKGYLSIKNKILDKFEDGSLSFDADEKSFTLKLVNPVKGKEAFVLSKPNAYAFSLMDQTKPDAHVGKLNKLIAGSCKGIEVKNLSSVDLDGSDYSFLTGLYGLFLGS